MKGPPRSSLPLPIEPALVHIAPVLWHQLLIGLTKMTNTYKNTDKNMNTDTNIEADQPDIDR